MKQTKKIIAALAERDAERAKQIIRDNWQISMERE